MSQVSTWYAACSESLDPVLGSWEDKTGSNYKVELDGTGYSCSVVTVRSSGETKYTRGLIKLADKPDGRASCIHWGGKFALELETASSSQIRWKHTDEGTGKDFLWWRSSAAEIATPAGRPPRSNSGRAPSWQDTKAAKYEEALQAWGVSSSPKVISEVQRTPWPSWSEVEHMLPRREIAWPAWAQSETEKLETPSAEDRCTSTTVASSDVTRSKLLDFLLARSDLMPRRKDFLRQSIGGYFSGHLIQEADVDFAIAAADERLYNASGEIHESPLAEHYFSAVRDVASVTTSAGATNEGDLSLDTSENEAAFDPLGRAGASCTVDDDSDISSEHFA